MPITYWKEETHLPNHHMQLRQQEGGCTRQNRAWQKPSLVKRSSAVEMEPCVQAFSAF